MSHRTEGSLVIPLLRPTIQSKFGPKLQFHNYRLQMREACGRAPGGPTKPSHSPARHAALLSLFLLVCSAVTISSVSPFLYSNMWLQTETLKSLPPPPCDFTTHEESAVNDTKEHIHPDRVLLLTESGWLCRLPRENLIPFSFLDVVVVMVSASPNGPIHVCMGSRGPRLGSWNN